jgi:NhaP-type Na+/H+ or K+/H+ antiporter
MTFALWSVTIGSVLVMMALAGSILQRLPLSAAIIYLGLGYGLSNAGAGTLVVDPIADAELLEHLTEVAVLVSLFTAGLKLRVQLTDRQWGTPLRLATVSMAITVGLIAVVGVFALDLRLGAAVLLGAVLAPTDPVLAGDVQVQKAGDRDRVRFGLTGEAGMNDGTAFPFVMLGLGLLGLHELGEGWWHWWAVDVLWAGAGGLVVGFVSGTLVARLVLFLRQTHREALGLDNFLALGLIALSYGIAVLMHGYGFLAVFAAGLSLRRVEMQRAELHPDEEAATTGDAAADAVHPHIAPTYMAEAVLKFNEQLEKLLEVAAVVILGVLLAAVRPSWTAVGLAAVLFLVIRPAAVWFGLVGSKVAGLRRGLIGWFGVRGIGSLYYLAYAIGHGVPTELGRVIADLVIVTLAVSVLVHGVSVTPVMEWYAKRRNRGG